MKPTWELKEEILLSIAWDDPEIAIPFSIHSFANVLSELNTKKLVLTCKSKIHDLLNFFLSFV